MKKNISILYVILSLFIVSCNDTLNIVEEPEVINTDLAFAPYGFQVIDLYTLYNEYDYTITLNYKDSESLNLSLIEDAASLNDFNILYETDYKILPESYYSLTKDVKLTEASQAEVPVKLNVKKIIEEIGVEESANYVISLKAESTNEDIDINSTGGNVILSVLIKEPVITYSEAALNISVDDTTKVANLSIPATFGFNGFDKTKVTATVNLANVATYNSENGTDYSEFPSGSYVFNGVIENLETKTLSVDLELDVTTAGFEVGSTYVLPVDLSSDSYSFNTQTLYYVVTITGTKPNYEAEFDLNTVQKVTGDYSASEVKIDLEETASLLNTTVSELENNITLYALNTDEISFTKDYTANAPGYWFHNDGNAGPWGDNASMYVEYKGDGVFNVGQFPDRAQAGEEYKVGVAFAYNDLLVRYNITLHIASAFTDLSIDAPQNDSYAAVPLAIDINAAAAAIGVSTDELKGNMSIYALNSDATITAAAYTANNGYWLDNTGSVCNWGAEGCSIYIEYDNDTTFNVGQYPGATNSGDSFNYTLMIVYDNDKFVAYNITVTIT
ncbi:DUF4859 domain-containing protein [Thalassobellus citreus]|uniref:DUF4859 domain-containing protein n=1 Tax=Thalassobellus citreus TaxID=3367752 RepID=UPI0037AF1555